MQRAKPRRPRLLLHELHRLPPPPAPALPPKQIQLINERTPPQPLQAVSKAQHDVPDCPTAIQDEPHAPEIRIAQQSDQRHVSLLLLEAVAVENVILPHKSQQSASIGLRRQPKLRFAFLFSLT